MSTQNMGGANGSYVGDGEVAYTLDTSPHNAVAFAQNTRDEIRMLGGDGQTAGAQGARPGAKQQTYVLASAQAKAELCADGSAPTLTTLHEAPIVAVKP